MVNTSGPPSVTPNPAIHHLPPALTPTALTAPQIAAMRQQIIEAVIRQILLDIQGFFTPGPLGAGSVQLQTLGDQLFTGVQNAWLSLTQQQALINGAVAALLNNATFSGASPALVQTSLTNLFNTVVQNSADIQDIKAASVGNVNSGKTYRVNFSDYPNGALPAIFDVHYSGGGSHTIVVSGGETDWTLSGSTDRAAICYYNAGVTDSDFQIGGGTAAGLMDYGASNRILLRVNSAADTMVWAEFTRDVFLQVYVSIGCTVSGSETVLMPPTAVPAAGTYWFIAGASGVGFERTYQILAGSSIVVNFTETGTTSQYGASYRGWGFYGKVIGASAKPARMRSLSCSDNTPAPVVGSHAAMYRTSTGLVNLTGGSANTALPSGFWGAILRSSGDITPNVTNGTFLVTEAHPYHMEARIKMSFAVSEQVFVNLNKNGVLSKWGRTNYDTSNGLCIGDSWDDYLVPGDLVSVATWANGGTVAPLTGEGTGLETYFSITRSG